jgi:hypothetical protein
VDRPIFGIRSVKYLGPDHRGVPQMANVRDPFRDPMPSRAIER